MPEGDRAPCKNHASFSNSKDLQHLYEFRSSRDVVTPMLVGMWSDWSEADYSNREPDLIRTVTQSMAWACAARLGLSLSIS